jgi:hypothetical protein
VAHSRLRAGWVETSRPSSLTGPTCMQGVRVGGPRSLGPAYGSGQRSRETNSGPMHVHCAALDGRGFTVADLPELQRQPQGASV